MVKTSKLEIQILREEIPFSKVFAEIEYSVTYEKEEWTSASFSEYVGDVKVISIEDSKGKEIPFTYFSSEMLKEIDICAENFIMNNDKNASIE